MSVYANQFGINIAEAATLFFSHEMKLPQDTSVNVAIVTMPIDKLKEVSRLIEAALADFERNAKASRMAAN